MGIATIAPPKPPTPEVTPPHGEGGYGGEGKSRPRGLPTAKTYRIGMWIALVPIVMMFISFTSAMVVRRGLSNDWVATPIPPILWLNTVLLLASSLTLESARHSLKRGLGEAFSRWLLLTTVLGVAFVAGQFIAWWELVSQGVYLASNPSSSFFYLLTVAHGVHLFGGLLALGYLNTRARVFAAAGTPRATALDVTAIYWHFMDGLWIYVFTLLLLGR